MMHFGLGVQIEQVMLELEIKRNWTSLVVWLCLEGNLKLLDNEIAKMGIYRHLNLVGNFLLRT